MESGDGEYTANLFEKYCEENGIIIHVVTTP